MSSAKKPTMAPLTRQLTSHLDQFIDGISEMNQAVSEHKSLGPDRQSGSKFSFLVGEATDIGGGAVNQDTYDVFRTGPNDENLVLAVYDGHGRELGELAAIVARDKVNELLQQDSVMREIEQDPRKTLCKVFASAHQNIKDQFRERYESANFQIHETEEGYLIKRRTNAGSWTCTHGGTTATVVIIFGASGRMVVANVGDSTALFGGMGANQDIVYQELSAEHSPESIEEFKRVRDFLSGENAMPEMRFVYDSPSSSKNQCPPVFEVNQANPEKIRITSKGNYYKNVRNEWATLVTTPPHARFQDALAFTRSLGDLHLHVYGVSSEPDVREYDLAEFHNGASNNPYSSSCLLVCTDGIWDNWKYNDIIETCMKPEMIETAISSESGKIPCEKLMEVNLGLAKQHFGDQADNMTAIVVYVVGKK